MTRFVPGFARPPQRFVLVLSPEPVPAGPILVTIAYSSIWRHRGGQRVRSTARGVSVLAGAERAARSPRRLLVATYGGWHTALSSCGAVCGVLVTAGPLPRSERLNTADSFG